MKQKKMILRCYAKRQNDGLWVACCIDLALAAQGDTLHEAKRKLHAQVIDYVHQARTVDRAHAAYLMSRKAPLVERLKYHYIRAACHLGSVRNGIYNLFEEKVPVPA